MHLAAYLAPSTNAMTCQVIMLDSYPNSHKTRQVFRSEMKNIFDFGFVLKYCLISSALDEVREVSYNAVKMLQCSVC